MKPKIWIHVTAAATTLLLSACGESGSETREPGAELSPVGARVVEVSLQMAPAFAEVGGETRAAETALIAAKVMGEIESMPATLGQAVKQGELLVRIASPDAAARVAQAEAQLSMARRELERERALLAKNASTRDLVAGLEDRRAAATAGLEEARAMLRFFELRAPFDGVVSRKLADAGSLASPGMPLLELQRLGAMDVAFEIPDSLVDGLELGQSLMVELPANGARFEATLVEWSGSANPATRSVSARLRVPSEVSARPGQFARVRVPSGDRERLIAPSSAVEEFGQMERLFVVERGRASLRLVRTGERFEGGVEILSGLEPGEIVVVDAVARLRDGQPVEAER